MKKTRRTRDEGRLGSERARRRAPGFRASPLAWMLAALLGFAPGCDRAVEPYVPGEQPEPPDLSRIFPEGAERAAELEAASGAQPGATAPPMAGGGAPPPAAASGDAPPVTGTIRIAPELEGRVPSGATLFLIARRGAGGGPPLAVQRIPAPTLPLEFSIGPGDRMIQQMPFAGPLQLSARLDGDGNAMTRVPGDLQGDAPEEHQPGDSGVSIVIDQVL